MVAKCILDVRDRVKLTRALIALLPEHQRISENQARLAWWHDIRPNGGLRLTHEGYATLTRDLDLERYEMQIPDPAHLNTRTMLRMNQQLKMPYYIMLEKRIPRQVVFFGSQEAMLARLYGDIQRFLEFYR